MDEEFKVVFADYATNPIIMLVLKFLCFWTQNELTKGSSGPSYKRIVRYQNSGAFCRASSSRTRYTTSASHPANKQTPSLYKTAPTPGSRHYHPSPHSSRKSQYMASPLSLSPAPSSSASSSWIADASAYPFSRLGPGVEIQGRLILCVAAARRWRA